ncbi:MAG: cell envelope integrity protein CreD [Pseudomonadota bacterium]
MMSLLSERISVRFLLVAGLIVLLLVPVALVDGVAAERERYYRTALESVAQAYGYAQQLSGPLLIVPATTVHRGTRDDGKPYERRSTHEHIVLPQRLDVAVDLSHQYRRRGLYDVPVYLTDLRIEGHFDLTQRGAIDRQYDEVHWDRAQIVIGVSDPRAIKNSSSFRFEQREYRLQPGTQQSDLRQGLSIPLDITAALAGDFALSLTLAGTERLAVAPVGDQTRLQVRADWPHPSFDGTFLPYDYELTASGFDASWAINALARGVPTSFRREEQSLDFLSNLAGVSIYQPVTQYTIVDRGLKYAVLFLALTFLAVLCFELITQTQLHLVQFGVIGLAMVLFYLVVLALSEHIAFGLAYVVAASLIVGLLTNYARGITRNRRQTLAFFGLQVALYSVLFLTLRLEDAALLTGTTLLVLGLAALMWTTRNLHRQPLVTAAV